MMSYQNLLDLLKFNRSYRKFKQDKPIDSALLYKLIDLCRYTASGRNAQPLKYRLVFESEECEKVYPLLTWAAYLRDWDGPEQGQRPAAYIVQCLDTRYGHNCLCDDGLQLEAITLGAATHHLGGCIIKSFNAQVLKEILNLPSFLEPRYVLALGYPAEDVKIEDMDGQPDSDFKYYRTSEGVHHVPKRPLSELII